MSTAPRATGRAATPTGTVALLIGLWVLGWITLPLLLGDTNSSSPQREMIGLGIAMIAVGLVLWVRRPRT